MSNKKLVDISVCVCVLVCVCVCVCVVCVCELAHGLLLVVSWSTQGAV